MGDRKDTTTAAYCVADAELTVAISRIARKFYHGAIVSDQASEPIYACQHHHHSRGSARNCAKRVRAKIRAAAEECRSHEP